MQDQSIVVTLIAPSGLFELTLTLPSRMSTSSLTRLAVELFGCDWHGCGYLLENVTKRRFVPNGSVMLTEAGIEPGDVVRLHRTMGHWDNESSS
jgi:hypothetical protein